MTNINLNTRELSKIDAEMQEIGTVLIDKCMAYIYRVDIELKATDFLTDRKSYYRILGDKISCNALLCTLLEKFSELDAQDRFQRYEEHYRMSWQNTGLA